MIEVFHIALAMKPLEGGFAENAVKHGVAGLNVDGSRVGTEKRVSRIVENGFGDNFMDDGGQPSGREYVKDVEGRWPANVIHDGSEGILAEFPDTQGVVRHPTGKGILDPETGWNNNSMKDETVRGFADEGSAARFFFQVNEFEEDTCDAE